MRSAESQTASTQFAAENKIDDDVLSKLPASEREWFGEHLLHPTRSVYQILCIRCPHGTVLVDMVDLDRMAAGMDVDVAAGVENQRYTRGRMVLPTVQRWWSRTDCRHCASVTNSTADAPQTSIQEKIAVLEKTIAGMGDHEGILPSKRVLEEELERHPQAHMEIQTHMHEQLHVSGIASRIFGTDSRTTPAKWLSNETSPHRRQTGRHCA